MTARDDSTRTATVDDDVPWRPMRDCPPHRRCILRNASGSPCFGVWDGRDDQWTGWHLMPVVPDWMRGESK